MFKPEVRPVLPETTAVARLEVGVATTATEVVPKALFTVEPAVTVTVSTVIELRVFTVEA